MSCAKKGVANNVGGVIEGKNLARLFGALTAGIPDSLDFNELPMILQRLDIVNYFGRLAVWILLAAVISLYSTRIVLDALDVNNFGVYNVVAGLITLLEFIKDSLVVTTQRYISYYSGKKNLKKVRIVFSNSLTIHVVFALLLALLLLLLREPVVNNFLNIDKDKLEATRSVYAIVILTLSISVVSSPFKALFIARENIVYISVVEILYAFLKLFFALSLTLFLSNRLVVYAWMNTVLVTFSFSAFLFYALAKYPECSLKKTISDLDWKHVAMLLGFAGWTTYGSLTVMMKMQGLNLILNYFFGTVANAAYGVAMQVFGAFSVLAVAVMNAMNPRIMKAAGANDRERMYYLVEKECKYSSLLLILFTVPILVNLNELLAFWLKVVPQNTAVICSFILLSFICDQQIGRASCRERV